MRHLVLASLPFLVPPAVGAAEPTADGWTRHPIPGPQAVSVELPREPEHRHAEKGILLGTVVSDTLVVQPDGGWCAATLTDAPRAAMAIATTGTILRSARNSVLSDTVGEQTAWEEIHRGGHGGRRLRFTTTKDSGRPQVGRSEIFTWGTYVATFTCVFHTTVGPDVPERFFASIRLPEP